MAYRKRKIISGTPDASLTGEELKDRVDSLLDSISETRRESRQAEYYDKLLNEQDKEAEEARKAVVESIKRKVLHNINDTLDPDEVSFDFVLRELVAFDIAYQMLQQMRKEEKQEVKHMLEKPVRECMYFSTDALRGLTDDENIIVSDVIDGCTGEVFHDINLLEVGITEAFGVVKELWFREKCAKIMTARFLLYFVRKYIGLNLLTTNGDLEDANTRLTNICNFILNRSLGAPTNAKRKDELIAKGKVEECTLDPNDFKSAVDAKKALIDHFMALDLEKYTR